MRKDNLACHRIGEVRNNNFGSLMEIVKYDNCAEVVVNFIEHGIEVHCAYKEFKNGSVKNPYDKTVYGVGYIGEGRFKVSDNNAVSPSYVVWNDMLSRCYNQKRHQASYSDCTVSNAFHNFNTFANWYEEYIYQIDEKLFLDKDILNKGNKIYSPETCVFVPRRINNLFTKSNAKRGDFPIGVSLNKQSGKYAVNCGNNKGKYKYLGSFNNVEEAFNTYKCFKESIIKQVANEYKYKIPSRLYEAMMKYEVEITD